MRHLRTPFHPSWKSAESSIILFTRVMDLCTTSTVLTLTNDGFEIQLLLLIHRDWMIHTMVEVLKETKAST